MRKTIFLMAALLLSAIWVVAQTTGAGQAGTPTPSPLQNSSISQSNGTTQNPQSQTGTASGQMPGAPQNAKPAGTPSTSPNTQTGSAPQAAPGGNQTIEGCLSGTPGEYILTTKSGQVYALAGDGSLLGDHIGQDVRLTGAQTSGNSAGATGTPAPGATAGTPATQGSAAGGTPYGSTGTTGSQPGATAQSQPGATPGQANTTAGQAGASTESAASSGPRFQVSNLEKVSEFCNMPKPH